MIANQNVRTVERMSIDLINDTCVFMLDRVLRHTKNNAFTDAKKVLLINPLGKTMISSIKEVDRLIEETL